MFKLGLLLQPQRCRHAPVLDFSRWEHSRSGQGFWISNCQHCGTEMTKPQRGRWQPVALNERD